jgi:hypothetical protein
MTSREDTALRLLTAVRAAGCDTFIEDDLFFCSPPLSHVEWDGDVEEALEDLHDELLALLSIERDAALWRLKVLVEAKLRTAH